MNNDCFRCGLKEYFNLTNDFCCGCGDPLPFLKSQDFDVFQKTWKEYPSQDNEGYQPDRGGFKCGWFAALEYERNRKSEKQIKKVGAE